MKEKHVNAMTIPELRRAFEKVEVFVKKGTSVEAFQTMWKKTFGKPVSKKAAEDYLAFVKVNPPTQKGGAAPLDYMMRAGADIPHGSYPNYLLGGMAFPKDSFHMSHENISPRISAHMGSNEWIPMKGGKRKTRITRKAKQTGGAFPSLSDVVTEAMTRPFGGGSPPSAAQDLQMLAKGGAGFPSPRAEINELVSTRAPTIYTASAARLPNTL